MITRTADIRGLICIDLWERDYNENPMHPMVIRWLQSLPEKLLQYEFHSIINASYFTKIEFRGNHDGSREFNDISIKNTMSAYNWQEYDEQVMMEMIREWGTCTLSQVIHDKVFGANTFALYSVDSLIKHCNRIVPHVKDWLVIGNCWKNCVHDRGLGLINLSRLPGHNFYGTDWGFMKENNMTATQVDFEQDFLGWDKIDHDLYKLRPNYV